MDMTLPAAFGLNLRHHREALGLSQEAFADVLEFHRTYVGGVERGERNLSLQSVERIAEKLDVDPLTLLQPPEPRAPRGQATPKPN